jgi:hypothetical protein
MHFVYRTAACATRRRPFLLQFGPVVPPASYLSDGKQLCIRLSSTAGHKSAAKNRIKDGANTPPKGQLFSFIRPLPTPPPPPKGTPVTINTHDIEQYVQPLYVRGWGLLSGILPNGNDIAVLSKRFEFADAEALQGFLADLSKYEEKKQVRSLFRFLLFHFFYLQCQFLTKHFISITQRRMCLRIDMLSSSALGRTSLEEGQMQRRKWRIRMRRHRGLLRGIFDSLMPLRSYLSMC